MANLPVPAPRNFSTGETETGSFLNSVRDTLNFLLNPPIGEFVQATAQAGIATATWTSINFDTTNVDSYGAHSNTTNNSRYTAVVPGWYEVSGAVAWASNGTGARACRVAKNGVVQTGSVGFLAAVVTDRAGPVCPTWQVFLAAGDYVEIQGFQSSGGALSTDVSVGDLRSSMNVRWVHV